MELPINFIPFMQTIYYYRNELNIDCLTTRQEQFRFYIGYVDKSTRYYAKRPEDHYQDPEPGFSNLGYDCIKCLVLNLSDELTMMKTISVATYEQILWYLQDIYPHKKLKKYKYDDATITFINHDHVVFKYTMTLKYTNFKTYCEFYHIFPKPYMRNIKLTKECVLEINFSENTARCIEDLINNKNINSYKNASDLLEYMKLTDYLGVSFD
jgi:hypothetical protein